MSIEHYALLKTIHICLVILSLSLFSLRGLMMIANIPNYRHKYFRYLTATNDSILLIIGISLVYMLSDVITHVTWFWEKMLFLILYIVSGSMSISHLDNKTGQISMFLTALLCAAIMLTLALTKESLLFALLTEVIK